MFLVVCLEVLVLIILYTVRVVVLLLWGGTRRFLCIFVCRGVSLGLLPQPRFKDSSSLHSRRRYRALTLKESAQIATIGESTFRRGATHRALVHCLPSNFLAGMRYELFRAKPSCLSKLSVERHGVKPVRPTNESSINGQGE